MVERVLDGWLRYYAVPNSYPSLQRFTHRLRMMWLRVLRRRSHMDRTRLDKLGRYAAASWPPLKILHPWPEKRFSRHIPQVGAPCVSAHCWSACVFGADRRANPLTSLESEGSSVDASVDASISLNVSGHVVRCGHLSGLMMRLV